MKASTLSDIDLFPDEDINEFMSGRLRLIQSRKGYRFSIDAILLAEFATTKQEDILIDLDYITTFGTLKISRIMLNNTFNKIFIK